MQAFFSTKDMGSDLEAGTIFGGNLDLPPVWDTGLGGTKVKQDWGAPTVVDWVAGDNARLQGEAEGVGQ